MDIFLLVFVYVISYLATQFVAPPSRLQVTLQAASMFTHRKTDSRQQTTAWLYIRAEN